MALLETCSDMVLRCSDGRCIPCIRYYCLSTCEVIRNLAEDVELDKDPQGRAIVPFPNVDSADLALATSVIHGATPVTELTAETTSSALRGMRALGHTALVGGTMERLWALVQGGVFDDVRPHINELLHTPSVRHAVLQKLVVCCPTWPEFSAHVLGALDMDLDLARWLLGPLVKFFPAGPLFVRVLRLLPFSVLNATAVVNLFVAPRNASAYHPAEALDVLEALADLFHRGGWDPVQLDLFRCILAATREYDVAPHVANAMSGSIVLLTRTPAASMLLSVTDRHAGVSRKMSPWLFLNINRATGDVDARLTLEKLDDLCRSARRCQVRLTAYAECDAERDAERDGAGSERDGACEELWYVFPHVHPLVPFSLAHDGHHGAGCPQAFRNLVRAPGLARLRIDLFYGDQNVLTKAFF